VHKGITQLHSSDTKYAAEKNYNIKLVANARRIDDDKIVAFVLPTFVESKNQLHHIRNEFNGVLIGSKLADEQFLYGKGAGRYPTSSAVLSDIAALRYDYKYEYKKTKNNTHNYQLSNDFLLKIFVSFNQDAEINVSFFDSIEDRYFNKNRNHLVGFISLKNLQQADWFNDETVSVIAFYGDDNKISTTTFLHETILN
jgi:homoserine dehydrogenase